MRMNIPQEARCAKNKLHRFISTADYPDAFLERCEFCAKRTVWRKDEFGRIAEKKYLRAHFRTFLQPYGVTGKAFQWIYGWERYRQAIEAPRGAEVNWDEGAEAAHRLYRELKIERTAI